VFILNIIKMQKYLSFIIVEIDYCNRDLVRYAYSSKYVENPNKSRLLYINYLKDLINDYLKYRDEK